MAKTYQNLLTEAREILQDSQSPFRYTDATLLNQLNRALMELGRLRPDAFTDRFDDESGDIIVPEVVVSDATPDSDPDELDVDEDSQVALTSSIDWPMQFYPAMVAYVIGSAELTDDEFTDDGRAATLLSIFKTEILGL